MRRLVEVGIVFFLLLPLVVATNMKCHYDKKSGIWECELLLDYIEKVGRTEQANQLGIKIYGTDYYFYEDGKIFLQLLDKGQPINQAICLLDLFDPNKTKILDDALMPYLNDSDGLYYYEYKIPPVQGVYMLSVKCLYLVNYTRDYADDFTLTRGTVVEGTYEDTWNEDRIYHTVRESVYSVIPRRYIIDIYYEFENVTLPDNATQMVILWKGEWTDTDNTLYMYLWNWDTSSWDLMPNRIAWYTNMISNTIENESISKYLRDGVVKVRFYRITTDQDELRTDLLEVQLHYAIYGSIEMMRGGGEVHVYDPSIIFRLEDSVEERLVYNHDYCIDNTTLRKELLITKCVQNICWNITRYEDTVCTYGCYEGRCVPSPLERYFWVVLILVGILVLFFIIWKVVR